MEAQNSTDLFSRPFVSLSATSFPAPKKTIHVTNMDRDRSHFFKILLQFPGFDRVAFYNDYSFVCFQDISHAVFAIDEIMNKTKMKASFAKVDFIHHAVAPSQIGTSNSILRISDFPSNMTHAELIGIFQTLEGFLNATQFYVASCLVHFKTQENGRQALERLNHATNMTAIYSIKGIKEPERPSKLGKSSSELPALYPLPVRPRPTSAPSFQPGSHRPPSSLGGEEQQQMQPSLEERNLVESGARNPGAQSSSVSLASNNSAMTDQTYKDSGLEDHHQVEHGPFQGVHYDGSTAQMPGPFSQDAPLQPLPHGIPPPVVNLSLQFEETKAFLHSLVHRVHFLEHENALLRGALMAQNQSRRSPALNPESVGDDQSVRDDPYASYHSVNDNNSSGNINKKGMLFETPSSLGPNNAPPFLGSFYPSSQQSQIPPSYRPVQHNPTHNNTNNLNTNPGLSVWGPPHMDMANASITNTKKHRLLSASNNGQQQGHPSQSMSHEGPEQEDESRPHIGMLQGLLDMCE